MNLTPTERALVALRSVLDPEIGVNVVELGLVYGIDCEGRQLKVRMTLTSAACPMGAALVEDAKEALAQALPDYEPAIELVWDPPWSSERMSEAARHELGWDD